MLWVPLFADVDPGRGGSRRLLRGCGRGSGDGEVGGGEHRQRDMAVPGSVAAHLVVVETGFVLGGGKAFFDRPAGPGHGHELGQARAGRVWQR